MLLFFYSLFFLILCDIYSPCFFFFKLNKRFRKKNILFEIFYSMAYISPLNPTKFHTFLNTLNILIANHKVAIQPPLTSETDLSRCMMHMSCVLMGATSSFSTLSIFHSIRSNCSSVRFTCLTHCFWNLWKENCQQNYSKRIYSRNSKQPKQTNIIYPCAQFHSDSFNCSGVIE